MHEITVATERRTQIVNVTDSVRAALGGSRDGAAALVYVPHTTAAVTINEHIDPELLTDLEESLERLVSDSWHWRHDDADGPNGPSHMRASLIGPQVVVPLRDGELGLGRYQGIFLCEFDGPRTRTISVTVLQ